jgi:hypothetical protein
MIKKVEKIDQDMEEIDPQSLHYQHTLNALSFIRTYMTVLTIDQIPQENFVNLPHS